MRCEGIVIRKSMCMVLGLGMTLGAAAVGQVRMPEPGDPRSLVDLRHLARPMVGKRFVVDTLSAQERAKADGPPVVLADIAGPGVLDLETSLLTDEDVLALAKKLAQRHEALCVQPPVEQTAPASDVQAWSAGRRQLPPVIHGSLSAYLSEEWTDASCQTIQENAVPADSQAATSTDLHPRLHPCSRVRTDDAGVGRRVRREQGNRVRARRRSAKKGLSSTFEAQGTLFAT